MKFKVIYVLLLLILNNNAFSHGGPGGGAEVSLEEDLAIGSNIHLPVQMDASGEMIFGYELPFLGQEDAQLSDPGADEVSSEHSHSFHISPSASFSRDRIDRLVSKDSVSDVSGVGEVSPAKNGTGYIHIKSSKLLISAGLELNRDLNVGAFGAGLGLSYARNHTGYSEVHLKSIAEKGRKIKMPGNYDDFSYWRQEEKLSYLSSGSIIFNVGVGIDHLFHSGVVASATGTWLIKLKKISPDYLNVSVSSEKAKSFGVEIDNLIVALSFEKLKSAEKSLNFNLNMRSPKVVSALKQLYNGDFRAIQKLTEDRDLVQGLVSSEAISRGAGRNVNFSVPVLFGMGASKYSTNVYQTSLEHDNQEVGEAYSSIISKDETSRGILSNHKKEINQFATTFMAIKGEDHNEQFLAANFKWHYEKDDVKASVVKSKLRELALQVGYEELNKLKFNEEELSHLRISFDISFTESDIYRAVNVLSDTKGLSLLKANSEKNIVNYVKMNSYQEICPHLANNDTTNDKNAACVKGLKTKTLKLLDKLSKLSKSIKADILNKRHATVVAGVSQLGTLIVKNQFAFRDLMEKFLNTKVTLSIEGEKVAKQRMLL